MVKIHRDSRSTPRLERHLSEHLLRTGTILRIGYMICLLDCYSVWSNMVIPNFDLGCVGLAGMTKYLVRGPRTISLPCPEHRAPAGARRMRDVYLLA